MLTKKFNLFFLLVLIVAIILVVTNKVDIWVAVLILLSHIEINFKW